MNTKLVLSNLCIYFFVELTVISKNGIHFFELLNDKVALLDDRFHCDTAAHEHLIDRNEFSQLRVVDELLEFGDFVLKRDH